MMISKGKMNSNLKKNRKGGFFRVGSLDFKISAARERITRNTFSYATPLRVVNTDSRYFKKLVIGKCTLVRSPILGVDR